MKNFYVIIGPDSSNGEQQYWDATNWEWTWDFDEATHYEDKQIFFMPIPPGTECIIEFTEEDEPIREFQPGDPPLLYSPFEF